VLIAIDVHAAVFLEVDQPKPVVLSELAKGWLTERASNPAKRIVLTSHIGKGNHDAGQIHRHDTVLDDILHVSAVR
jgi:hypothetical protein